MTDTTDYLDPKKAAAINPLYSPDGYTPNYIQAGDRIPVEVESRAMEIALIKAYDYGIDSLTEEGRKLVQRFVDDAVLRMSGKIE